ncbi:2-keto-4-pentenoate hydratase/2-oxohepta-3-ene-1,7-dioic acid hydratase (catechol pathway) [Geoalkalibacter ferrihydriticus]|uniref:Acylpyruvase n=2 Tax=Geoalkalibacter ferrihydriticus TaxID=392333 RepID=A0A0C2EGX4_9BACT|nr:fumarylacetoacetate hydrolase family protein [Geoalkalibacter ferrihydriticus]KIH77908.1 acylpyruvase [Geoalkalibacter ferrihydriticus DSM 17813]SDM37985.1 2-keto-4-pentenoate hydratase/2-oxohepta-3-ene-1,7-dioic acid hydratase (catechol pathway) [Geoalkalibacter ferrihydriticus]
MITVRLQESNRNFSIGKIICLGRNYAAHIQELGNEVPEEPVVFMKPATSIIRAGEKIVIPPYSRQCQHEVELALLIGRYGKNIPANEALNHIAGYGVALDMTLRDVQNRLKKKGLPWEIAKGFDTSCPISDFAPRAWVSDPHNLAVRLWVNGELRQDGHTSQMLHRIPNILAYLSRIFTLEEGDLILTGTPAGVGEVVAGDRLRAEIEQVGSLEVSVL